MSVCKLGNMKDRTKLGCSHLKACRHKRWAHQSSCRVRSPSFLRPKVHAKARAKESIQPVSSAPSMQLIASTIGLMRRRIQNARQFKPKAKDTQTSKLRGLLRAEGARCVAGCEIDPRSSSWHEQMHEISTSSPPLSNEICQSTSPTTHFDIANVANREYTRKGNPKMLASASGWLLLQASANVMAPGHESRVQKQPGIISECKHNNQLGAPRFTCPTTLRWSCRTSL